jgi:hypothetical protein
MKRLFILFTAIIVLTGLPVPPVQAYDPPTRVDFTGSMDSFIVQMSRGNEVGISIEHYRANNGMIPVCLYAGELEITLRMNAQGQVRSYFAPESSPPVFIIDLAAHEIYTEKRRFPFSIQAQTPVRTRLRFLHIQNTPAFIAFGISRSLGLAEVRMDGTALPLLRLNIALNETIPGRFELIFKDPFVTTYADFIFEPTAGMIYSKGGGR